MKRLIITTLIAASFGASTAVAQDAENYARITLDKSAIMLDFTEERQATRQTQPATDFTPKANRQTLIPLYHAETGIQIRR